MDQASVMELSYSVSDSSHSIAPEILEKLKHLDLSGRVAFSENRVVSGGAYGDVSTAVCDHRERGMTKVAVKRLRFYLRDDIKYIFEKEIYVWSKLKHENVLPLLGYAFDDATGYPLLISEWMERGSTWTFVKENKDCDVLRLIIGIAKGLAYLHGQNIVHSDVKSDNVLVSDSLDALLCDFGCARIINASKTSALMSTGVKGTPQYLTYELLASPTEYSKHTKETDVWAFGMTAYELFTRQRPYDSLPAMQVITQISRRRRPVFPPTMIPTRSRDFRCDKGEHEVHLSETLRAICDKCWKFNPSERPSIQAILHDLDNKELPSSDSEEDEDTLVEGTSMTKSYVEDLKPGKVPSADKLRDGVSIDEDEKGKCTRPQPLHSDVPFNVKLTYGLCLNSCIGCIRYSPDGMLLAVACDQIVRIYSADSGILLSSLHDSTVIHDLDPSVSCLCFSPDGSLLVSGSNGGTIRVWERRFSYQLRSCLVGHTSQIHCLSFSKGLRFLVSGSSDGAARIWPASIWRNGESKFPTILQHLSISAVTSAAISPDCNYVVTWSRDEQVIRVWHIQTGTLIHKLPRKDCLENSIDCLNMISFTSNDTCIAIGRAGERLMQWEITNLISDDYTPPKVFTICEYESHASDLIGCAISPDDKWIVSGLSSGRIQLEYRATREVFSFNGHDHSFVSVDFNPLGDSFATAGHDMTVNIWRCANAVGMTD